MKKLAIITTHPIQYYAPVFKLLHARGNVDIKVFYTWGKQAASKYDPGFNKNIEWDIPLLDGYNYEWLENTAGDAGTHHFKGIVNPGAAGQISAYQPDALLIFGWGWQSHLKIMRHFSGKIPVYFRGDSTLLNEPSGLKKMLRALFLKWVYKHVDHAFFVGTNNNAYFKKYGLKESQLSFAPHAIDNTRFEIDRGAEAAQLRSALKIPDDHVVVLYAGKFEPVKNLGLLLSAFMKINRPEVHLILAGEGPDEPALKSMTTDYGLKENIHFTGFKNQTEMPVLYQAADLFCLPSKSETWGLVINEAMACGKAVLASDKVGSSIDLISGNGAIFKSNDVDDLTVKLNELTVGRDHMHVLGKKSKAIIQQYSFGHIAEAIEKGLSEQEGGTVN